MKTQPRILNVHYNNECHTSEQNDLMSCINSTCGPSALYIHLEESKSCEISENTRSKCGIPIIFVIIHYV